MKRFCFYLEDILIFLPNMETHTQHTCRVLQRLLENQLFKSFWASSSPLDASVQTQRRLVQWLSGQLPWTENHYRGFCASLIFTDTSPGITAWLPHFYMHLPLLKLGSSGPQKPRLPSRRSSGLLSRASPPVQWPDRADEPGAGVLPHSP